MFIHCVALLFVHSVALLLVLSPASRCRRCPISRRCRSSPPTVVRALRTPRDPLVEAEAAEKPGVLGLEGERLGLGAKKAERGADQLQHERGQISVTKSLFHRGGTSSLTALAIFMLNTLGRGAAGVAVPPAGFRLVEAACEEVGYIGNSWETLGALVGTQCTQRLQEKSWRRRLQRRRRLFPPVGRSSVPWRQRREAKRGATAIPGGHCVRPARRHSQSHFIKKGAIVENNQSMTNNGMLKFLTKVGRKNLSSMKMSNNCLPGPPFCFLVDISPLNLFPL